jgi:hypothetical protein
VKAVVTGLLKAVKASIAAAKKANGKRPTVNGKR